MAIYKRGDTYHYSFIFGGRRYRKSTHQGNPNVARNIESALRTQLAKGQVGIQDKEPVPSFQEFAPRFEKAIETLCKEKPATIEFYKERMRRLLDYLPLATAKLDEIDEQLIEKLKRQRTLQISRLGRPLSIASINRELATLRRLLRLAEEWKVIPRLPRIRLFAGEQNREYVLSYELEELYLHMAPHPLKDIALLVVDTGARPGEACALTWSEVRLTPAPGARCGYIRIAAGKSKNAKRNLSLTGRVREMLERRKKVSRGDFVFPSEAGGAWLVSSLDHQHLEFRSLMSACGIGMPKEFVVHSLRHTMLTRLGEAGADAFTIMRIAGHSSVTVSQRYVHPTPQALETAFERMDALNRSQRGEDKGGPATKSATAEKLGIGQNDTKPFLISKTGA